MSTFEDKTAEMPVANDDETAEMEIESGNDDTKKLPAAAKRKKGQRIDCPSAPAQTGYSMPASRSTLRHPFGSRLPRSARSP